MSLQVIFAMVSLPPTFFIQCKVKARKWSISVKNQFKSSWFTSRSLKCWELRAGSGSVWLTPLSTDTFVRSSASHNKVTYHVQYLIICLSLVTILWPELHNLMIHYYFADYQAVSAVIQPTIVERWTASQNRSKWEVDYIEHKSLQ